MTEWLHSLTTLEYAMLLIAIPATVILLLQTVALLVGLHGESDGDGDVDVDGELDGDVDVDGELDGDVDTECDVDSGADGDAGDGGGGPLAGLKLFTLRGLVAFVAILGWGSLWLLRLGLHPLLALFIGVAMGVWAMVLVALLLRAALGLQNDGTIQSRNALGRVGTVYLTVPAARQGVGKLHVLVQDQLTEFSAVTDDPEPLTTGTEVVVVELAAEGVLVARRR